MYVITVDFLIKPEAIEHFMPLMRGNATASLEREPGCIRFDVCVSTDDPCRVFLYEVYRRKEDFDLHLTSEHFIGFNAVSASLVVSKAVRSFWQADA